RRAGSAPRSTAPPWANAWCAPVADGNRPEQRAVQHGEVARKPGDTVTAQGGEHFGDGPAHKRENPMVCCEAYRIGPAAVESRGDAGDERGVVNEPSVHVGDTLDGKPACRQVSMPVRAVVILGSGIGLVAGFGDGVSGASA